VRGPAVGDRRTGTAVLVLFAFSWAAIPPRVPLEGGSVPVLRLSLAGGFRVLLGYYNVLDHVPGRTRAADRLRRLAHGFPSLPIQQRYY
jgi:hypothetical protein